MTEQRRKLGIRERSCGVTSPPKPKNHSGFAIGLASAHGSAKTFIAPINAPPQIVEIKRGTGVWVI